MKKMEMVSFSLFAIIVLISGWMGSNSASSTDIRNGDTVTQTVTIVDKTNVINGSFDDLMRNNENYIGRIIYFRGQIDQFVDDGEGEYILRVSTKPAALAEDGYIGNTIILLHYNGKRVLEGDIIDLWGISKGLYSYTSVFNAPVTLPELDNPYIELVKKSSE